MYGDPTEKCLQNCGYVLRDIPTESPPNKGFFFLHLTSFVLTMGCKLKSLARGFKNGD